MKASLIAIAVLSISVSGLVQAADLDKAERLLKQQHAQQCVLRDPAASAADKTKANRKTMEIGSEIGKIKMGMMSDMDAQVRFIKLQSKIGKMACASSTSSADYDQQVRAAVQKLKKTLCAARRESDPIQMGIKMASADKARRTVKDLEAELDRTGNKAALDELESQVHTLEMGGGC